MDVWAEIDTTVSSPYTYTVGYGTSVDKSTQGPPQETETVYTGPLSDGKITLVKNEEFVNELIGAPPEGSNYSNGVFTYEQWNYSEQVINELVADTAPVDTEQTIYKPGLPGVKGSLGSPQSIGTISKDRWIDLGAASSASPNPPSSPDESTPQTILPDGSSTALQVADVGSDGSITNPSTGSNVGKITVGPNAGILLSAGGGLGEISFGSNGQTYIGIPSSVDVVNSPYASGVFTNDVDGLGRGTSATLRIPIPDLPGANVILMTNPPNFDAVGIGLGYGGNPGVTVSIGHPAPNIFPHQDEIVTQDTVFKFKTDSENATIYGFQIGGADHDSISLPASDFTNLASVLHNTSMVGGSAVISMSSGNTITLEGIKKKELYNQFQDFKFHP